LEWRALLCALFYRVISTFRGNFVLRLGETRNRIQKRAVMLKDITWDSKLELELTRKAGLPSMKMALQIPAKMP
jgi:hypothetical protein